MLLIKNAICTTIWNPISIYYFIHSRVLLLARNASFNRSALRTYFRIKLLKIILQFIFIAATEQTAVH